MKIIKDGEYVEFEISVSEIEELRFRDTPELYEAVEDWIKRQLEAEEHNGKSKA